MGIISDSIISIRRIFLWAENPVMQRRLSIIWQGLAFSEREWIEEIFGDVMGEHIPDGRHEIVADNSLLIDSHIHRHPSSYYAQFREKNAFLLHLSDESYAGGYEIYKNFRGVFRNYWSAVFRPQRVFILPLGYCNGLRNAAAAPPSSKRRYVWSFLGSLLSTRSSRPDMVRALASITPNFFHTKDTGTKTSLPPPEYQKILLDTVFTPCPMGNVNLECFRVYEALECGSIPIVEKRWTLNYFNRLLGPHPLPAVRTWRAARALIHSFLHKAEALDRLQQQCTQWWREYKSKLRSSVLAFMESCSAHEHALPAISFWQGLPLWRIWELCRHLSLPAMARRLRHQLTIQRACW